ncbi:MAG: 5'/3'-nucleotidase SurE [Kiritimatiellales bacterium]
MRILLCNDDGIFAPGIATLHEAVKGFGEVYVVAPDVERSAAGHAITIADPIKCAPVERHGEFFGYGIGGTPADCIKLAVRAILRDTPPDIVLSGVNLGSNTGISVIYSGTVSAATESVILGIPAVAFSLCNYMNPNWETGRRVAGEITKKMLENPLPPGVLLNVNIPSIPYEELRGIKITRMGRSRFIEKFHERLDPRGRIYYWLDGELEVQDAGDDVDIHAVSDGFVSITPIQLDMTAYADFGAVRKIFSQ